MPETQTCPTFESDPIALFNNETILIDAHRQLADDHGDTIRALMAVVFSIMGIIIVLGA